MRKFIDIIESNTPSLTPALRIGEKIYRAPPGYTHGYIWDKLSPEERTAADAQVENPFIFIDQRGRILSRAKAVGFALDNDLVKPQYRDMLERCRDGTGGLAADFLKGID